MSNPDYRNVRGHIEVHDESGKFLFSEDSMEQAVKEYERGYCEFIENYCTHGNHDLCDLLNKNEVSNK